MNSPDERDPGAREVCPFYFECCRSWGINPVTDRFCVRERRETVSRCPQIVDQEGEIAFASFATDSEREDWG